MNVRLSSGEFQSLVDSLDTIQGEIFLYGSRTISEKKGGDIDILIISDENPEKRLQKKLFITRLFQRNTDQKIDVTILPTQRNEKEERFFRSLSKVARGQIKAMYKTE